MQQRQPRLGDILDDYCPRERRVTNHAVVAMVGEDVKQTRCTTCDADHEYKHAKVPRQRRKDTPTALYCAGPGRRSQACRARGGSRAEAEAFDETASNGAERWRRAETSTPPAASRTGRKPQRPRPEPAPAPAPAKDAGPDETDLRRAGERRRRPRPSAADSRDAAADRGTASADPAGPRLHDPSAEQPPRTIPQALAARRRSTTATDPGTSAAATACRARAVDARR